MDIDLTADGSHAYKATVSGVQHRVVVGDALLESMGVTAAEEPLVVRRTLELAVLQNVTLPSGEVALEDIGASLDGFPDLVTARLRT